jgi:hypothetical protein
MKFMRACDRDLDAACMRGYGHTTSSSKLF